MEADARVCEEGIHVSFAVNGVPVGSDDPLVRVRIGDTLELDAGDSCTRSGTAQFSWVLSSAEMSATALPGLNAQAVSVFPPLAGAHTISLTVSDGSATSEPVTANVEVVGWDLPDGNLDVRDIAATPGLVWIAASDGAHYQAIGAFGVPPFDVNDLADGDDDVPNDLAAAFGDDAGFVWFGRKPSEGEVWRVDVNSLILAQVDAVDFRAGSGLEDSAVRDIGATEGGVALATNNGVTVTGNGSSFGVPLTDEDVHAVDGGWAGGDELYRLGGSGGGTPFGGGDNKIRAVLDTGPSVWVGSDDKGIAQLDGDGTLVEGPFEVPALPSNKVRALVAEEGGDVWAATDAGVARYKQDRKIWFAMGAAQGLSETLDVRALAVGVSVDGDVYLVAGTSSGLAVLPTP